MIKLYEVAYGHDNDTEFVARVLSSSILSAYILATEFLTDKGINHKSYTMVSVKEWPIDVVNTDLVPIK